MDNTILVPIYKCRPSIKNPTKIGETLVDRESFEKIQFFRLRLDNKGYVVFTDPVKRCRSLRLHRFLLNAPPKTDVDHINMNILDNRLVNLRLATRAGNMQNKKKQRNNSSGFKGVSWRKDLGLFQARVQANGRSISVGFFNNAKAAAEARDILAKQLHGRFFRASVNGL